MLVEKFIYSCIFSFFDFFIHSISHSLTVMTFKLCNLLKFNFCWVVFPLLLLICFQIFACFSIDYFQGLKVFAFSVIFEWIALRDWDDPYLLSPTPEHSCATLLRLISIFYKKIEKILLESMKYVFKGQNIVFLGILGVFYLPTPSGPIKVCHSFQVHMKLLGSDFLVKTWNHNSSSFHKNTLY